MLREPTISSGPANPDAATGYRIPDSQFVPIFKFAIYKKCLSPTRRNGALSDDNSSDSSSTSTTSGDGAWQIDSTINTITGEILTDRELIARRHRKRLKILDKVAPIQSLHDWRADKSTKHEQTFATLATKLICAICLDLIDENEQIRELHCGHVYHAPCLNLRAVKESGTQTQTQTQQIQGGGGGGGRGENTATATGNAATAATPAAAGGLAVDPDGDAVVSTEQSQSHSERGEREGETQVGQTFPARDPITNLDTGNNAVLPQQDQVGAGGRSGGDGGRATATTDTGTNAVAVAVAVAVVDPVLSSHS
ncbi:hypothetical protein KCU88_g3527, partial [Aureobasidium melanogenum]